ncbi:SH3 domain-containing protein [Aquimarina algicola]|uniref:SH3 domain-containing protein n=1 Tax=Aquimarina algicola TaxID=2589995 RepID=A0A504J0K0_9FLAO|nr:hypothetical protein [Aquimarina algicola]TPN83934.1 hypothetical protein FHK87_18390 [Aquimarina algicola]
MNFRVVLLLLLLINTISSAQESVHPSIYYKDAHLFWKNFPAISEDGSNYLIIYNQYSCCVDTGNILQQRSTDTEEIVKEIVLSPDETKGLEFSTKKKMTILKQVENVLNETKYYSLVKVEKPEQIQNKGSNAFAIRAKLNSQSFTSESFSLPPSELHGFCCTGNYDSQENCAIDQSLHDVWFSKKHNVFLVQSGVWHSADGCDDGPYYKIVPFANEKRHDVTTFDEGLNDKLTILGNRIWVRSEPISGKLVFTANDGDVCRIIDKGERQTIGLITDYWYQIVFKNKKGWVFGSQTSIKQEKTIASFKTYLAEVLETYFFGKRFDVLMHRSEVKPLKHKDIGYFRLYNPGITCNIEFYENSKSYRKEEYPEIPEVTYFENKMPINGFCEESKSPDGVYFTTVNEFPSYVILSDEFTNKKIDLQDKYNRGTKMKAVILHNKMIIKTLYFVALDNHWWLVVVDDCDCSA